MTPWRFAGQFPFLPTLANGTPTGANTSYPLGWTEPQARAGEWGWKTVRCQAKFTVEMLGDVRTISFDEEFTPTPGSDYSVLVPDEWTSGGRFFEISGGATESFGAGDWIGVNLTAYVSDLKLIDGAYFKHISIVPSVFMNYSGVGAEVARDDYGDAGFFSGTPPGSVACVASVFGASQNIYASRNTFVGFPGSGAWSSLDLFKLTVSSHFAAP